MKHKKDVIQDIEEPIGQKWRVATYSNHHIDQYGNKIYWKPGIPNEYLLEQKGQGTAIQVYNLATAKHISKILLNDFIMHKDHNK